MVFFFLNKVCSLNSITFCISKAEMKLTSCCSPVKFDMFPSCSIVHSSKSANSLLFMLGSLFFNHLITFSLPTCLAASFKLCTRLLLSHESAVIFLPPTQLNDSYSFIAILRACLLLKRRKNV